MKAIEVGLLTCGSSYSPTPSQPSRGQWPALLVFVPAYSGASVRELHPLPKSIISRANIATSAENYHLLPPMSSLILPHQDQRIHGAVRETIVHGYATGVVGRHGSHPKQRQSWAPAYKVRRPPVG